METKLMKTCDLCKARKVRCVGADLPGATGCANCVRRSATCHFSPLQKPRRKKRGGEAIATTKTTNLASSPAKSDDTQNRDESVEHVAQDMSQYDGLQELYVDRLLANPHPESSQHAQATSLHGLNVFGNEYSLTFFSEARLASLALKLGHDRVTRLRTQVTSVINERMKVVERVPAPAPDIDRSQVFGAERSLIATYIQLYFEHVHPSFPFLDQKQIETAALGEHLAQTLASDKSWSALFYTVLALGSQYNDGGGFQPSNNISWRFFSTALALFPDLLISKAALTTVQAITAMAIYASTVSSMQFSYVMISEGAKKAQALGYNRLPTPGDNPRNRAFWVLYCMEKTLTFTTMRGSVIMDSDISSAVPSSVGDMSGLDNFDWFVAWVRLSRLSSRIYASLHSVSVRGRSSTYYKTTISLLKAELETWRASIPAIIQPDQPIRPHIIRTSQMMRTCVKLHFSYDSTMLHLERAALQLEGSNTPGSEATTNIMRTARSILGVTKHIDVQPYTPLWELAGVPLSALLVLFDLVIDNPTHPDTAANLALIDVGCGYFSHIEYASEGALPGSITSEFSHIARSYVREKNDLAHDTRPSATITSATILNENMVDSSDLIQPRPATADQPPAYNFGPDWNLQDLNSSVFPGTDILDLFGSSLPGWENEWVFRTTSHS